MNAKQLAELNKDDLAGQFEGMVLGLKLINVDGKVQDQEIYDRAKEQWDNLVEAEDWDNLAAMLAEAAKVETGGMSGQMATDLETAQTRVAREGVTTSSGDNAILGYTRSPIEVATEELEGADRALLERNLGSEFEQLGAPEAFKLSDYGDWLQNISVGDKDRLAQALFVKGYYNSLNIKDMDDITDPTYFANAIEGALQHAATSAALFGESGGMAAVPTLEEGGRLADVTEEQFEEAERIFLRDSGPTYYPTSYLKQTGKTVAREVLGRNLTRREEQQYIAMANKLLDDQSSAARLRNEQVDLQSAGIEFTEGLAPEEARAKGVGDLMSVVDKVLGL
jgi:hypothetical protein